MQQISKKARISLILDTRRVKDSGLYPVKLRVYCDKAKMYDIGQDLTKSDFANSYETAKPKGDYKDLKIRLAAVEANANEILDELKQFTFESFEKLLFRQKSKDDNIIVHYQNYIDELETNEQIGTASSYRCSIKSIQTFISNTRNGSSDKVSFRSITAEFLNKYEQWMVSKGNSKTTVGIYLRPLRKIFNLALSEGQITNDIYPFKKYKIPSGKNIKKALESDDLSLLHKADLTSNRHMEKARDFWFFSYQCNGMNFRDIAELKFKNFGDTYFSFLRHKTKNTTKEDPTPIVVPITSFVTHMIEKYGNKDGNHNDYVFPILNNAMSAKDRHRANANFIRYVNQHMKKLAALEGLKMKLGTMAARHTFTTRVTRVKGLAFAQESLGHTSMSTTQNYWKGFENADKKEMADMLMDF